MFDEEEQHPCENGCGVLMHWSDEEHCWECPKCGQLVSYPEDDEEPESLNVTDAALIWASNGKDEDYTFGYTDEELEAAL